MYKLKSKTDKPVVGHQMSESESDSLEMGHLDSELIIMAVKNYPCIYDINCQDYKDRSLRAEAWDSICRTVVGELWDTFSKKDQSTIGKEVQKKWKNMRDAYRRSVALVQKNESGCAKPKPYVYYKQMSFLRECSDYSNEAESLLDMGGSEPSVEPWQHNMINLQSEPPIIGSWHNIGHEKSEASFGLWHSNMTHLHTDKKVVSSSRKRKLQYPLKLLGSVERESTSVVSGTSQSQVKDHDEMFLQSLLPYMKTMSNDDKLDFQIKTLQLIQTYSRQKADQK